MASPTGPDPYELAETRPRRPIRERFGIDKIDLSFTLGSGWSAASDDLGEEIGSCPLGDLPGFSAPVVIGHGGLLRIVRTASGKTAGGPHRAHPLLRGPRRGAGRPRRPDHGRRRARRPSC